MEAGSLQIRTVRRDDLAELFTLYAHLTTDDEPPPLAAASDIVDRLASYAGSAIFVGELEGRLVASCTLIVIPNLTRGGRSYGLIENVVSHQDYRMRGFGRAVLGHATAAAWNAGCYKVMLLSGSKRPETLRFYLDAGFEQSKTGFQKRQLPLRSEPV